MRFLEFIIPSKKSKQELCYNLQVGVKFFAQIYKLPILYLIMINILFNPKRAERHPFEMMFVAIFYSSISILLSSWLFPEQASLIMVFLTVLSCFYVIQGAIRIEENKERKYNSEGKILKEHSKLIFLLLFLFIGFIFSFAFWTFVLPDEKVSVLFNLQISSVEGLKANIATGAAIFNDSLSRILSNNFRVLLISLIFSLFYGAGSIFVLVWNASTIGFVIGNLAKSAELINLPLTFAKYLLHGIPEMLAYLTIALAGGIIYISLWKGNLFKPKRIRKTLLDVLVLSIISIFLLIIAALLEVYVSPYV